MDAHTSNRFTIEAQRAISRFRNIGPATLATTIWRAARLHLRQPRRKPPTPRNERVVVTLTTVPARAKTLAAVLRGLLDQSEPADRIVLALPRATRRGEPYPKLETMNLPAGIDVVRCDDEGPATKLLPTLKLEAGSVLIVVDDDVIYPHRFIETLLAAHRLAPGAALGFRGVQLAQGVRFPDLLHIFATGVDTPTPVDVLFGTWGYLLPPGAPGEDVHDFSDAPAEARWVDDVWISGHLARAGIPRLVVVADELPLETPSSLRASLTSGINKSGQNDEITLNAFAGHW
ncbi:conserved hypothetical protein; putative Nucleotide-diphospho-sugar transferases [Pseudorhizobium banfieldiae]|uniref:Glycosyltransferase n=1 Tax=Pseudorhizobium banfieldiae TaxID=1125847 RepID=L0NBY9_9HYPH|nr:glycosyltransferase family A protein [Pseudorhizobium banfieldiae]CAD6601896.1 glycosyltransferase family 2 protein [arsenite-oxidising bacterium NT-25]CCF18311.1 conserved hypothetical protein; putative Nucleotide-diphospho-sugar transferases [Pseudorhizobium banfieldiae]